MNRTVHEEIRAENLHFANEINARQLEQYHGMLNAFNTQATLIVGFALSAVNHDNLNALANDQSKYCIYRSNRPAWGYFFISGECQSSPDVATLRFRILLRH